MDLKFLTKIEWDQLKVGDRIMSSAKDIYIIIDGKTVDTYNVKPEIPSEIKFAGWSPNYWYKLKIIEEPREEYRSRIGNIEI